MKWLSKTFNLNLFTNDNRPDYLLNPSLCGFCRVSGVFSTESPSAEPLTNVADNPESSGTDTEKPLLPRSHSERLLAVNREFVAQEKELREKYHEAIYNAAEKYMRSSQTNQLKTLRVSFVKLIYIYFLNQRKNKTFLFLIGI